MRTLRQALERLLAHKLLWAKETILLTLIAAHVPAWLWLPLSGSLWLAMHVVLPVTMLLLVWYSWRMARTGFGDAPVSWLGLAAALAAGVLLVWGLLSVVPVFGSVAMQTASFVARSALAAALCTGLLLLPFALARENGK